MNTNSLKRFATAARKMLIAGVRNRLKTVGFNEDGSVLIEPQVAGNEVVFGGEVIADTHFYNRWTALHKRIISHGIKDVVEEAAYTWFNRLVAIRILVRNNLAQSVLDYANPSVHLPRIVTDARAGQCLYLSPEDGAALERIIGDGRLAFEQFAILIRAYCESNAILRSCFGGITDYTSLLLPADILAEGNFLDMLNSADDYISSEDYQKPELIGWLYQFYISEKKDEVFAKKGGYESDEIPAATQIFTPNWIVKYMVENTLGRIYLDNNPGSSLAENWEYLVEPTEPTPDEAVFHYNAIEDLRCADLSCGSGHILNEMFDILYQQYEDDFYSPREAIEAIFTKNLIGIDIDIRARQLAQFALMLKACQRDNAFVDGHCLPRIYSMPEVDRYTWLDLGGHFNCTYEICVPDSNASEEIKNAFIIMEDADALGSIMKFDISDNTREYLVKAVKLYDAEPKFEENFSTLIEAFRIILALTDKYVAICMNPPYMPTNKEAKLKSYAAKEYSDSKSDLFAVFMDVAIDRLHKHGKYGMINMQSWMFLSSFEALRNNIIAHQQIDSLLHLGPRTFDELSGEVVQNAAFVITKENPTYPSVYYRLIDGSNCNAKREMFLDGNNCYVVTYQHQFQQIPGAPIAYWVSEKIRETFTNESAVSAVCKPTQGLATADNGRFVRSWFEVAITSIGFGCESSAASVASGRKFFPTIKGGGQRKWYGNQTEVINWYNNGDEIKNFPGAVIRNEHCYFKPTVAWNMISSAGLSFRYYPNGFVLNNASNGIPCENISAMLGYLNTPYASYIATVLNPTVNLSNGVVGKFPNLAPKTANFSNTVAECISISKQDWDAHETSWDFETSPLLAIDKHTYFNNIEWIIECHRRETGEEIEIDPAAPKYGSLEWRYNQYCLKWEYLFDTLHNNEEELNRKFIDVYGLQDELNPDVALEDVTILQQGEIKIVNNHIEWQKDVILKQFISYAVGCMMGRYRLDRPGLAIAHPNPESSEYAPYAIESTGEKWWIDDDGIVPMMDDECGFHDNATNRFTEFVRVALGNEYLTDNLNFVRDALGNDIVDYFRTDFYADHKKMYQNRPIYWMFSSNQKGKRAAFQCLVYMHRMNRFTPEHIRTKYLLPYIERLAAREAELSGRPSLSTKENKQLKQLRADLEECRDYQLSLHEFADRQIELDLDDGVVKNYATFAPVLAKLK